MQKIKYYGHIEVETDVEIDDTIIDDFEDFLLKEIGDYFQNYPYNLTVHAKDNSQYEIYQRVGSNVRERRTVSSY